MHNIKEKPFRFYANSQTTVEILKDMSIMDMSFRILVLYNKPLSSSGSGGNYYVKNMDTPKKDIGIKLDTTDNILRGYVDNKEIYFQSFMPVPDYSKRIRLAGETHVYDSWHATGSSISPDYCLTNRAWRWYKHEDSRDEETHTYFVTYFWDRLPQYKTTDNGYIIVTCNLYGNQPTEYQALNIFVLRNNSYVNVFKAIKAGRTGYNSYSDVIPVRKGDIIIWSADYDTTTDVPGDYSIDFVPVLKG